MEKIIIIPWAVLIFIQLKALMLLRKEDRVGRRLISLSIIFLMVLVCYQFEFGVESITKNGYQFSVAVVISAVFLQIYRLLR